ncbi:TIGR00374 family protein [Gammaproteobacteria bacterium]
MQYIKYTILALTLGFMGVLIADRWEQIQGSEWRLDKALFSLSLVGGVVILFLNALGWHLVLRALGQPSRAGTSMYVWLVSSTTRYIPGGIWSIASRAALARNAGISMPILTTSLYLEAMLTGTTAFLAGLPALLYNAKLAIPATIVTGLVIANGFLLHPRIIRLAGRLPGKVGKIFSTMPLPNVKAIIALYLYYLIFWFLLGVAFLIFVQSITPVPATSWINIGSSMALSFFLGFVVLIAPGGLGVRESTLFFLLLTITGSPVALVVSIGSRLWLMISEAISVAIALLLFDGNGNADTYDNQAEVKIYQGIQSDEPSRDRG